MIGRILVATLLVGLALQQCTIGCLRCNAKNECLLCDVSSGYYSSATTCALSTQTNCQLIDFTGACVLCSGSYYLDVNSKKCLAVASAFRATEDVRVRVAA